MAGLLTPFAGSYALTQPFNGHNLAEPRLWFQDWRGVPMAAFEYAFPGASGWTQHYHGGLDYATPSGTPLRAMERGKVVSLYVVNGNRVIKVAINAKTIYSYWHLSAWVSTMYVGKVVARGQVIAYSGSSGASASHVHVGMRIRQTDPDGVSRNYLYDPSLFYTGHPFQFSHSIQPGY